MEDKTSEEIFPGVEAKLTETGLVDDIKNAWSLNLACVSVGDWGQIKSVKHYQEYFEGQDEKYKKSGKPGLFVKVMQASNPEAVAAFNELVDKFNQDLPEIIATRNTALVKEYEKKVMELMKKPNPNQEIK